MIEEKHCERCQELYEENKSLREQLSRSQTLLLAGEGLRDRLMVDFIMSLTTGKPHANEGKNEHRSNQERTVAQKAVEIGMATDQGVPL